MNSVNIIGRLGHDPELRYTPTGIPVCTFSLAVDRPHNSNNPDVKETDWPEFVAWRGKAEFLASYVRSGDMVSVSGRLQTRNYTDKDGTRRKITETLVIDVKLMRRSVANQEQFQGEAGSGSRCDYEDEPVPA